MAEYIELPNGKRDIKFHEKPINFRRVIKLTYNKKHFEVKVDKNDAVYEVLACTVKSWKAIEKGKRKFTVPDVIIRERANDLFNIVKGRPSELACERIQSILESASVESNL